VTVDASDVPSWIQPLAREAPQLVAEVLDVTDAVLGERLMHPRRGLAAALMGQMGSDDPDTQLALAVVGELYGVWQCTDRTPDARGLRRFLATDTVLRIHRRRFAWIRQALATAQQLPDLLHTDVGEGALFVDGFRAVVEGAGTAVDHPTRAALRVLGERLDGGHPADVDGPIGRLRPGLHARQVARLGPVAWSAPDPVRPLELAMMEVLTDAPGGVRTAARHLLARGGKRIRPTLLLELAGEGAPAWALDAAARVEWVHQVSLVLDDLIDASPTRRGSRCLHESVDPLYALAVAVAILRCVTDTPLGPPEVARLLGVAGFDLARGQVVETVAPPHDLPSYLAMVRSKTGSLFRLAAELGQLAAGDNPRSGARFGEAVGLAFQIEDDCLDLVGDPAVMGKQVLQDVRLDRVTAPLLELRARLSAADQHLLGGHPSVDWIRMQMENTGALAACRALADSILDEALARLSPSTAVVRLARSVVRRTA
jgi:geranylgeranyl pyrophosphate synthase